MRKATIVILPLASLLFALIACSKKPSAEPDICDSVYNKQFVTDVNPIIQTYCNQAACHEAGSTNGAGPLTTYTEIFNARARIREQVEAGLMPQNTTLTTAQKNTIICWIYSGAPNN
jgi:hypothetical protein